MFQAGGRGRKGVLKEGRGRADSDRAGPPNYRAGPTIDRAGLKVSGPGQKRPKNGKTGPKKACQSHKFELFPWGVGN